MKATAFVLLTLTLSLGVVAIAPAASAEACYAYPLTQEVRCMVANNVDFARATADTAIECASGIIRDGEC